MSLRHLLGPSKLKSLAPLLKRRFRCYSSAVIKSPYEDIEIPPVSLPQYIWGKANDLDHLPAVTCGTSGRSYTRGMVKMLYKQGAKAFLEKVGLKPGDTVGFLLPNIPEFMIVTYASMEAGLLTTCANPLFTLTEVTRQFVNCKVKCIVTVNELMETANTVAKALPDYTYTVNIGGKTDLDKKILDLQSILSGSFSAETPKVQPKDIAILPYSSGTTGLPKGVMLTHENLVSNLVQFDHPELKKERFTPLEKQEVVLSVLPFFHIMGFNAAMNSVMNNAHHLITILRFTPQDYIKCLIQYKPTTIFVVPSLLQFLTTHPEVTSDHLSSIFRIISGAAPAPKNLWDKVRKKMKREDLMLDQGYGMTEASPVILYTPLSMPDSKIGSCGKLLPSTQARLIDTQTQSDITTPNITGELLIKGPQVMLGYFNDPKSTQETIDSDGWLHTGDVAYYDEDEYFYIVDRTKELIKVKGNQVSPTELENLLLEIPGILDAAVIGVPDDFAGEVPKAFVVKKDASVDEKIISNYLEPKVAPYKRLAGGVTFIDAIPRNASGKIMRNVLKSM